MDNRPKPMYVQWFQVFGIYVGFKFAACAGLDAMDGPSRYGLQLGTLGTCTFSSFVLVKGQPARGTTYQVERSYFSTLGRLKVPRVWL